MKLIKLPFIKKRKASRFETEQHLEQQRKNILSAKSSFHILEAYKALRTNITFAVPKEGCCKICVTSALASEGKSVTVLNLALSFVTAGQRVLLIDADLRKPNQARLLKQRSTPGLSNILANLCTVEEAIHVDARDHLDVIFSGDIPPNPSELLGTPRMVALLEELTPKYDYIFIDTPPVNVVTDSSVVAPLMDGVLFVVRQSRSEYDAVSYAINQLAFADAKILGFVLNGVKLETSTRNKYSKYKKYNKNYSYSYNQGSYGYGGYYGHYGHYGRYGSTGYDPRFEMSGNPAEAQQRPPEPPRQD